MKIADPVWLCTWGIMKNCNIPHVPSTVSSGTQFSTLKSAGIYDPEGPEKYNNITTQNWTFYGCHTELDTCCCKETITLFNVVRTIDQHVLGTVFNSLLPKST
jgi:hypothetical protein